MQVVALCSGGKDSAYALWLAMRKGYEVKEVITMIPESEESWLFHTANIQLIDLFGKCAGLEVRKVHFGGARESEPTYLKKALGESEAKGVVSGVIASKYQKSCIDKICMELGMTSIMPLWGKDPLELMREIVGGGFTSIITLVAAEGLGPKWLGRAIDMKCVEELEKLSKWYGINLSGEGGEYETLVTDAPFFSKRIEILETAKRWDERAGRGLFEIKKAGLAGKGRFFAT